MATVDDRMQARRLRTANRRTAWALAAVALVFFVGSIASRELGPQAGLGAVGLAAFAFVVFAIGRHLRSKR
jgi:hypothetical protein